MNQRYLSTNLVAILTASQKAGTFSTLTIAAVGSPILKNGDVLRLVTSTGAAIPLTLTQDVSSTATTIRFSSITIDYDIPRASVLIYEGKGMITHAKSKRIYAQQSLYLTAGSNGNDYLSAFGTSTFSVNSGTTLNDGDSKPNRWGSQYAIFIAQKDCTLEGTIGWASSNAGTGDNATIKIWKASPNGGSTSNLTIDLVTSFSLTSQNNQNHLFSLSSELSSDNDLSAGDILFVSIQRTGSLHGSVKWYADIGFDIKMIR